MVLKNSIRIIGGHWRGRRIAFDATTMVRPTPDRVRETLFNWLMHHIAGARCLDLFTGSGILALEALSRGAERVVCLDNDPKVVKTLSLAVELLKPKENAFSLIQADALQWLKKPMAAHQPLEVPFDIIFVDPPYLANFWQSCLTLIQQGGWLVEDGLVYLESDKPLMNDKALAEAGFTTHRELHAGSVYAYLIKQKHS